MKIRENHEKIGFKRDVFFNLEILSIFPGLGSVLGGFWEGLGEGLGSILASKTGPKRAKYIFSIKLRFFMDFGRVWGGFWEARGRVLEGFGEGLGASWALLEAVGALF